MSTPYHAKYFALDLSRHYSSGDIQKLGHSLFDACVDINPHQIEAAAFALNSPLSKGSILADEVGLGKTIEAGLLLCQFWAERKRRLLVISPASLRKQWSLELSDKFHLPNHIIDSRTATQENSINPFDRQDAVLIVSIHFASRYNALLRTIPWDLVVIDEAHKLRNVYRTRNKMARNIKWALESRKKVLLTATPLQNSLLEIYGLSQFIDEQIFGDVKTFKNRFGGKTGQTDDLAPRLKTFVHRTLRNQVSEYIRYTERRSMTLPYEPTDSEHQLYEDISSFLQREESVAIPKAQRHLMTLVLRKILASSAYAIAGTLGTIRDRLRSLKTESDSWVESLVAMEELGEDVLDELEPEEDEPVEMPVDPEQVRKEIHLLNQLVDQAHRLSEDTKSATLLKALDIGFTELETMNAPCKAVVFTESRRTQLYLFDYLCRNGYSADEIVLFSGQNNDAATVSVYKNWLEANRNSSRVTGSRAIDHRTAILDTFRQQASILIATEAAAEGLNLQFCSLVINYDLPWNPQRIEQRIGRCHRYGQSHDVVVINFLNQRNDTDCRVYELLNEKFNLFNGVFGASDDVLGSIDSGVDFERRIHDIYQTCRTHDDIQNAFQQLQRDLEHSIDQQMKKTRKLLLEQFDRDVHTRLRTQLDNARTQLDHIGTAFWDLTHIILDDVARFDDRSLQFELFNSPLDQVPTGRYQLVSKGKPQSSGPFLYRLAHPLGEYVLAAGQACQTPPAHVYFDITNHPQKISAIRALRGKSGWLRLTLLSINSFEREDYLVLTGISDNGDRLDTEICEKLFLCRGATSPLDGVPADRREQLDRHTQDAIQTRLDTSRDLNHSYFMKECDKLDTWAEDRITVAERDLASNRKKLNQQSRQARLANDTTEQYRIQNEIRELELEKRRLRERLFAIEDEIMGRRDTLIDKLAKRMQHHHTIDSIFTIRWTVI